MTKNLQNLNPFQVPALNESPTATGYEADVHQVYDQLGNPIVFTGRLIGSGTTRRDEHSHPMDRVAAKGERCFACRWYEAYIYEVFTLPENYPANQRFMVATVGGTAIEGERNYYRAHVTSSGFEVVELLTIRKGNTAPYMSTSAARALSQAAEVDEVIREAYINRAVA